MKRTWALVACVVVIGVGLVSGQQPPAASAQAPAAAAQPAPTLIVEVQTTFNGIKGNITKTAAQFPEDKNAWQPTPLVRSWALLVAHVADDNNGACSALVGVPRPARLDTEDTQNSGANKMTKADLEKALGDSFALCDKAFAAVTEANMMERNGNRSKIGTLIYDTIHINEHYGKSAIDGPLARPTLVQWLSGFDGHPVGSHGCVPHESGASWPRRRS
jgi:hypothetical protein